MDRAASLEQLSRLIGEEHIIQGADEVSRNDIRRKLEVYCFDCPLHTDDEVARAHGYRLTPAPGALIPLWTLQAYWSPGEPPLFGPGKPEKDGAPRARLPSTVFTSTVNAAAEVDYFEPVYPGDRLRSVTKLIEVKPKRSRLGEGVFLTMQTSVSNQSGIVVCVRRNTSFHYDKRDQGSMPGEREPENRSDQAEDVQPPETPEVDWRRQLSFSEVRVGTQIPEYSVWLSYQRIVMSVAVDRMFSGIHHNRDYARSIGLRDIIFNTRGYETILEIMLRRWIGLEGSLKKFGPFRMVGSSHPGDTLVCGARVKETLAAVPRGTVALELWVDSPRGRIAAGDAIVPLPLSARAMKEGSS